MASTQKLVDLFNAEYLAGTDNTTFVKAAYADLLGLTGDFNSSTARIAFWTAQLDGGLSRDAFAQTFLEALSDQGTLVSDADFTRNQDVKAKLDALADTATLADVKAAAADVAPVDPTDPTDPGVEGDSIVLTAGADNETGTADNDTITANVQTNDLGILVNALGTGDRIDGGAGVDTIEASLIQDNRWNSDLSPRPVTENVENVKIEALEEVTLDAGRMNGVDQYWTDNSRDDLFITDIRLGDGQAVTKDITFGLKDVDTDAGLYAAFDTNSLTSEGSTKSNSRIIIEVGDSNKAADATDPLELISLTLRFSYEGQSYAFDGLVSADGTYDGLKAAIDTALDAKGLTGLVVEDGALLSQIVATNDTVPLLYDGAKQIVITDPAGKEFGDFLSGVAALPSAESSNPVSNISAVDPSTSTTLIETNVILDNAGRGSTAGDVVIGGMSNSEQAIEKLNLRVDNNSKVDVVSSATGMEKVNDGTSGNVDTNYDGTLVGFQEIELTSGAAQGDLSIADIKGTAKFDASAFEGDNLTISAGSALKTLDANISANVNVTATAAGNASYATGSGKDTLNITSGNGLVVSTGSDNDTVTVTMAAGVSQDTMEELHDKDADNFNDYMSINLGSGDDNLNLNAYGNFNIDAGNGNDFVRINSEDANGNAEGGTWTFGADSASSETNANTFANATGDARVLYQAKLTVSFAGFESTVDVETDRNGNFLATQVEINEAIKAAIENDTNGLAKLLKVTSGSHEQLKVESNVGGDNQLAIDLFQPKLVTGTADTGEVQLSSQDNSALVKGLIATTTDESDDLASAADVADAVNTVGTGSLTVAGTGNGVVDYNVAAADHFNGTAANANNYADSTAGGATNDTTGINFSTIKPGTGDDVVVLHSNAGSSNTLDLNSKFDTVKVVNYHDVAAHSVNDASQVGVHALDFTELLTDQSSGSGSSESAVTVGIELNIATPVLPSNNADHTDEFARSNTVNMLQFDESVDTDSIAFSEITLSNLVAQLNDTTAGASDFGGLNGDDLTATDATSGADHVGTTQNHIIMVENKLNPGEYKVFHVTSEVNAAGDVQDDGKFTGKTDLGTIDFGASINFELAGNSEYEAFKAAYISYADNKTTGQSFSNYLANNDAGFKAADVDSKLVEKVTPTVEIPAGQENLSVAGAKALVAGDADAVFSLSDSAASLAPSATVESVVAKAVSVTVNDAANTSIAANILAAIAAASDEDVTVSNKIVISGAAKDSDLSDINFADETTIAFADPTALTVAELAVFTDAGLTLAGVANYTVVDTLANLLDAAKVAGTGTAALKAATTITASDVGDTGTVATFTGLDTAAAGTAIDFDGTGPVTLTAAQVEAITAAFTPADSAIGLTTTDTITVTGVDASNLVAVTGALDANDTIVLADADISALTVGGTNVKMDLDSDTAITVTMTDAQLATAITDGLTAQATDTINVKVAAATTTAAATDAIDVFTLAAKPAGALAIATMAAGDKLDVSGFAADVTGTAQAAKADVDAAGEWFIDTGVVTFFDGTNAVDITLTDVTGVTVDTGVFIVA